MATLPSASLMLQLPPSPPVLLRRRRSERQSERLIPEPSNVWKKWWA